MTIKSRWTAPIPSCSLQQWIFGSATGPLPDKNAFVDPERPDTHFLTLEHYRLLSKRVALGLLAEGLQHGQRVLVFSGNSLFFPPLFLGILMAGGIFTGANPTYVARELAYQLKDSGASYLVVSQASLDTGLAAAQEAGFPRDRIFVLGGDNPAEMATSARPAPGAAGRVQGIRHWTELLTAASVSEARAWQWTEPTDTATTTCCLNYSSGTTGSPKGVEISHRSYVANGAGVQKTFEIDADWAGLQSRARVLGFLPMYHAFGQTYFIVNFPALHIPVYIMEAFDFPRMLAHIQRFRISIITLVPPIVVLLAKHPLSKEHDLSSLEIVGSGAAPLSFEVMEEAGKLFTTKRDGRAMVVRSGWGMTEVTCTCTNWDPNGPRVISGGVGEVMPNCAARLVSIEDGKTPIEKPDVPGELWVTGPTLMRGYWGNPQATANTFHVDPDGTRWLKTGDVAFFEGEYKPGAIIHVVDRIKELIKVKGNQVAPAELEGVLLDRHDVADAAVVGVTINGEEVPRAYIVLAPGAKTTGPEIAEWMAKKVAKFKQLRGGVAFVDAIPKNPSGKILRRQLRELAAKEVGDRKSKL